MRYAKKLFGKIGISIIITLILVISCTNVYAKSDEEGNGDFKVEVEYGLDGVIKMNSSMPVDISVTNLGKDFSGKVQIIVQGGSSNKDNIAYEKDIILPSETTKDINMSVKGVSYMTSFLVQITNEKDKVVYSKSIKCNVSNTSESAIFGILSDDYSGLNYIDGVSLSNNSFIGTVKILELNEENVPTDASGLGVCNYILIDNYNTSKLSDEQVKAIKQWVMQGGILIFGTGPNYEKVFEKFSDDFINGSIGDVSKQDIIVEYSSLDGLNNNFEETTEETETEGALENVVSVDMVDISVNEAYEVYNVTTPSVISQKDVGKGAVVIAGFDFALAPIQNGNFNKSLIVNLLENTGTSFSNTILQNATAVGANFDYSTQTAVNSIPDNKSPSAFLYGFIFLVYAICIGPIMYIILKKMKKREWMWVVIPALSMIFTGVILFTSVFYRVWRPFTSELAIVQLDEGIKSENVYGSIQSPFTRAYTVNFNEEYMSYSPFFEEDYYYGDEKSIANEYAYAINEGEKGISVNVNKGKAFKSYYFSAEKQSEITQEDIVVNIKADYTSFSGTVTNNTKYDLEKVVVIFNNYFAIIPTLDMGDTVTIDKNTLIYYDGSYSITTEIFGYDQYSTIFNGKDTRHNSSLNSAYEFICNSNYLYGNANGIVFGEAVGYKVDVIKGVKTKEYSLGIITKNFIPDLSSLGETCYLDISEVMVDSSGGYDSVSNYLNVDEVTMEYQFGEDDDVKQLILVDKNDYTSVYQYSYYANVSAYNVNTSQFELIFDGTDRETDLSNYIVDNRLILKYSISTGVDGTGYGDMIPQISAVGGEE